MDDRPLPSNPDAERAVLGAILLDNVVLASVSNLTASEFFVPQHQPLFRAITEMAERGQPIDLVTLTDELHKTGKLEEAGGAAYIAALVDGVPRVSNVAHYASILREKAAYRRLAYLGDAIKREALTASESAEVLLQRAVDETSNLSAQYRSEVWAENKSLFCTPAELAQQITQSVEWIVPGIVAIGAITELDGKVKQAGKTTFSLAAIKAIVSGEPFLGKRTIKTPVVYLTEEPPIPFREALERAGLLDCDSLFVLQWYKVAGQPWSKIAQLAREECTRRGAKLLVVDTLGQFTGIEGDDENNSGPALAAMKPLQLAAAEGIGVLTMRHERKSGGEPGDSGRGSSAFAGAVDIVLSLRRPEGNTRPTLRLIKGIGRLGVPEALTIEFTPSGYVCHGEGKDIAYIEAEKAIFECLPVNPDDALTLDEILESTSTKRATAQRVMRALNESRKVRPTGTGTRGDPYRYHRRE